MIEDKGNFIYPHKEYGLSCADFHETPKWWKVWALNPLYQILSKPEIKYRSNGQVVVLYVRKERVAFAAPVLRKFTETQ